jgi:hypothetical protein
MHHIMNRGDQREDIFRDDDDRHRFGAARRGNRRTVIMGKAETLTC